MRKISFEEAKKKSQKWYFTGASCKKGHIDKIYVNTNLCYACKRERNRIDKLRHPDKLKIRTRRTYLNCTEKRIKNSKTWAENNPEKRKIIKKRNKEKHKEKYSENERIRNKIKRATNPFFRLSHNVGKALWGFIKNNGKTKEGRKWEDLVGYKLEDLIHHLEKQFTEKMNWKNYGRYWHIDHRFPLSWYEDLKMDLEQKIKLSWELQNLRPLERFENLSKNKRYAE